jgi:hypothetical protein
MRIVETVANKLEKTVWNNITLILIKSANKSENTLGDTFERTLTAGKMKNISKNNKGNRPNA